jgi:hypothetical protein
MSVCWWFTSKTDCPSDCPNDIADFIRRVQERFGTIVSIAQAESPKETLACLIIDDPLLRPQYGCLNYRKLLEAMKSHRFFTEIAFIPWNYKRSDNEPVRLLLDNPDYFAICVHGCNHTGNEFGISNYETLGALSSTALWRMEEHKKITGLPYDPVMVFPQGLFSSVAIRALKDHGYFAAFNSGIRAADCEEPSIIEYRRSATMVYYDFPLFLRRYPKDRTGILSDLANDRPIVIVEHHAAFKGGYETITDSVDWINGLGNIRWTSLLCIAEHYLGKIAPPLAAPSISALPSDQFLSGKIALRRLLSEMRDNQVETNDTLTKVYKAIRRTATGFLGK